MSRQASSRTKKPRLKPLRTRKGAAPITASSVGLAPLGTAGKRVDAEWKRWLADNLGRGCDRDELFRILVDNGFSEASVSVAMGGHRPRRPLASIPNPLAARDRSADCDYEAISRVRLTDPALTPGVRRFDDERLQLYVIDDFLDRESCEGLVSRIARHLRPSTVTTSNAPTAYRTSQTCDLNGLDDPLVERIDERIADTLGISLAYSEPIQAQRYDVGQEFKQHTDYFEPGTREYEEHAALRGQRTWTFMVYLTEVEAGGGTRFLALNHTFVPRLGTAVVWNNLRPDGAVNRATLHQGCPVEAGCKVIITKWFRDRGSGPMLP